MSNYLGIFQIYRIERDNMIQDCQKFIQYKVINYCNIEEIYTRIVFGFFLNLLTIVILRKFTLGLCLDFFFFFRNKLIAKHTHLIRFSYQIQTHNLKYHYKRA